MRRVLVLSFLVACGGSGNPSGPDASSLTPDSSGADANTCNGGTLCGTPAECCAVGNECVEDRCLAACTSGVRCGADLTTCCGSGEVCLDAQCVAPGATCADPYDCEP